MVNVLPDQDLWIVVADGECALIFSNLGTGDAPNLKLQTRWEIENPPTHEQGTDKPGRFDDVGQGKSAVDNTDWHEQAKAEFATFLAEKLNSAALGSEFRSLLLIADAATLGKVRPHLHSEVQKRIANEKAADLTNHPVEQIEMQVEQLLSSASLR